MVSIISTHPTDVRYNKWKIDDSIHAKERVWDCVIHGGSGVVNRKTLLVPDGVVTEITDNALNILMTIPAFTRDIELGYIKVLKNRRRSSVDPDEEAKKDMNLHGSGRPLTDEDLVNDGAQINKDGSIDISKGGHNAMSRKNLENKETLKRRGRRK